MIRIIGILCILVLISCGSNEDEPEIPVLTRIEIESSNGDRLDLNEETTLTVNGFDQFNNPFEITSTIQWTVNNDHINIDQNGNVTAVSVGSSIITASVENLEATFTISVWDSSAPRTEIYVSDAGNFDSPPWQILKFDENGENPEVFTDQNLAWPQDIIFLEKDEIVLISNLNTGNIAKHNTNTGDFISNFATNLGGPTRMKIGPDSLLYVLQWSGDGLVYRYELDGTFVDKFTNKGVHQSIGLDWDADGNLYVSSFGDATVRKFDSSGNDLGLFISSNLQGPTNIWFDSNNLAGVQDLLVIDWSAGVINRFSSEGIFLDTFISGLNQPEGIAFMSNGNILVGNGGTGAVKMFDNNGNFIEDLISSGSGNLLTPNVVIIREVN